MEMQHPGGLNFKVGPQSAGCYTFGSTADAIRGSYDGCLDIAESDYNQKQTVVGGNLTTAMPSLVYL